MKLAEFIRSEHEQILSEWDTFARSCLPDGKSMDLRRLRDHASEILEAIAMDLNTSQTKSEQVEKSEGKSDAKTDSTAPDTAAQLHGADRADSGFDLKQMVSEYRALRASVIRLWIVKAGELGVDDIEDLMRFNEAIDQALAESTERYAQDIDGSKEMFIGILGHDLRTPLGAIMASAKAMAHVKATPETMSKAAAIILRSGQRMNALVNDLLDFTRSRLGGGIPVVRSHMDFEKLGRETVDELAAFHPDRHIQFDATGTLQGSWDEARLGQMLSNLIGNAIQHGAADSAINVTLRGSADEVVLRVQNRGPVIASDDLSRIFHPMHRVAHDAAAATHSLGLGLYIGERIVVSHGGQIAVESSEGQGTTFTIRLPKGGREDPGHLPSAESGQSCLQTTRA